MTTINQSNRLSSNQCNLGGSPESPVASRPVRRFRHQQASLVTAQSVPVSQPPADLQTSPSITTRTLALASPVLSGQTPPAVRHGGAARRRLDFDSVSDDQGNCLTRNVKRKLLSDAGR